MKMHAMILGFSEAALFGRDRRSEEREDSIERRGGLRPTMKLKLLGALAAAAVFLAIILAISL